MKLADVCAVEKQVHDGSPLPYVGLEDIESSTGRYLGDFEPKTVQSNSFRFTPEHLLYGRLRPYLNKLITPEFTGHCSTEIFPIRPSEQLDRKFLFYWLSMQQTVDQIDGTCTGARMPRANMNEVMDFEFLAPSLPEQKRIVAILDEAFAGIAAATANAEKNLANARELFDKCLEAAFLDFGDGWIESRFGDCFRLRSGDGLTSKDMLDGPYPVFGGNGIAGTHSHFNLSGNNVIIGRVGALCGNVRNIKEDIWLTDNAFKIVDYQHEFDNAFLTYLLNFKDLRSYARQTAQPVISNSSLKDVLLQFPRSLADQRHIAVRLDALSDKIEQLESVVQKKISTLAELKQAILQKAFSGELTGIKTRHCEAA